jgi:hypothetical protein
LAVHWLATLLKSLVVRGDKYQDNSTTLSRHH